MLLTVLMLGVSMFGVFVSTDKVCSVDRFVSMVKVKLQLGNVSLPITYEATPIEEGKCNNHLNDLKIKMIKGKDRYADWLA